VDRLQMSCEHVGLELRPKTSKTVSSAYKLDPQAEFFKNYGWLEKNFG